MWKFILKNMKISEIINARSVIIITEQVEMDFGNLDLILIFAGLGEYTKAIAAYLRPFIAISRNACHSNDYSCH
jgi:hypothetical protein